MILEVYEMNSKIYVKSHDLTDYDIGNTFGIFGFHNNIVAMKILHNLYERNNMPYMIIDRSGYYKNLIKVDDVIFFRVGIDISLNIFHFNNKNYEEHVITLAEMFQQTLNLTDDQVSILIEALLELYSNKYDTSLSLLINSLKTRQSFANAYESAKITSMIRLLYPLYLNNGVLAFDKGCKYSLTNINLSKPIILDLSYLKSIEAKNLASLAILTFYLYNMERTIILIDSINQLVPRASKQALSVLNLIDQLVNENTTVGITASSIVDVDLRFINRLSTLIVAENTFSHANINKEYQLKKNEWLLISNRLPEPIIISLDPSPWMLSDVNDDEVLQHMKTLGYELEHEIIINKLLITTTLETMFKDKSNAIADLLERASSMLITRSEAINILKKHEIQLEECETIIDEIIMHNLLKELLISGRRLLHITHQGSIILSEYKLKRGEP
jgi:archaellum biogenesis ATPase FlaH